MLRSFLGWLRRAPIADPVDQRNAPFIQLLLLFFGVFVPLNKAIFLVALLGGHLEQPPDPLRLYADLATDVILITAAWVAIWLIRSGSFRQGVAVFLTAATVCVGIAYASVGLVRVGLDPIPLVLLALAGTVLGRRPLWLTLAALAVLMAGCVAIDLWRIAQASDARPVVVIGKAVSIVGIWLIITVVLDRTLAALRGSLEESRHRGRELERANARLQTEIAERERAREQLIHSQKLDMAGRLASGLAHDFNNVLGIVVGLSAQRQTLADKGGVPALLEATQEIEIAGRRAMAISRKLLNFSRLEPLAPTTFDVGSALQDMLPMLRQLCGAGVRPSLDLDEQPMPVCMDRHQFELIVLNVASNARDALTAGGHFHVVAAIDPTRQHVRLSLADDGPGMPEEVRARALEAFFTTKPVGMGTGLGLSIVNDMVVAIGGDIDVACPPTGGTVVIISLPLAAAMPD